MLDWLAHQWQLFKDFTYKILLTLFDILKDLFFWIMEQVISLGGSLLDGFGTLFNGLDVAKYFNFLPPETSEMLTRVGFSEAMGMIVTCLIIRFFLQMIPLVRWGS
jgi:hypothetical protein